MKDTVIAFCLALALTVLGGRPTAQDGHSTDNAGPVTNPSVPLVLAPWVIACACLGLSVALSRCGA